MKKWLVFLCLFFTILSIIFYIFPENKNKSDENYDIDVISNINDNIETKEVVIYDELKSGNIIRLEKVETREVVDIDSFDYLRCVVASEMPANYDLEALKAQAIVARTYLMKKMDIKHESSADICSSSGHCQVYQDKEEIFRLWRVVKGWSEEEISMNWNKVNTAVISTDGMVITYDGNLIEAFFHASSPIKTENSYEIWGKVSYPYLVSVDNMEDENYANRESEVEIDYTYFEDKIRQSIDSNFKLTNRNIEIYSYTTSGRVNEINVDGMIISAEKLRTLFGLKSTLFTVENNGNGFYFKVIGYGHGVGMSQVGADYLAKQNKTYEEIIKYYYRGVNIEKR